MGSDADPLLQQAAYATGRWHARLEQGHPPSSWQVWLNQMIEVAQFRSGGQAGIPDDDFYHAARRYAERADAPETVRQVIAFRHALAGWNFRQASDAADRILPVVLREQRWIPADELRDGTVMAKLHVGDVAGARRALDTLSRH